MEETSKKHIIKYTIILLLIILFFAICTYYLLYLKGYVNKPFEISSINVSNSIFRNIKDEVVTSENYERISNDVKSNLSEDDVCYYSYCLSVYMLQDGLKSLSTLEEDDSAMYVRIYNKTVGQLIEEGKQLMIENNMTVQKYKENLKNLSQSELNI